MNLATPRWNRKRVRGTDYQWYLRIGHEARIDLRPGWHNGEGWHATFYAPSFQKDMVDLSLTGRDLEKLKARALRAFISHLDTKIIPLIAMQGMAAKALAYQPAEPPKKKAKGKKA